MPCYKAVTNDCYYQIDYSQLIIGDRIIPFVFELDLALSDLNPPVGQNQHFCYRVTGVGENISTYISLKHWVLSLCPNITLDQITNVEVTIDGEPQTVIIGENVVLIVPPDTDPATGCPGLMFDFDLNKVLHSPGSTGLFCFELTTPYPIGATTVCVKGSNAASSALAICGPVCPAEELCETISYQLINVSVPITVTPFVTVGPTSTICCGPLTIGTAPSAGEPCGSCTFIASQSVCVEVPVNFGAAATTGEVYVDCGEAASGECVCPPCDNEDD